MTTPTLIAKNGSWKQHPEEIKAKRFFDSLCPSERESIMDDLVLGVGIDWLDFDMPKPSVVFRKYFYKLIEDYDALSR